jgi:transcriptional regulator with XRE-family HTH domain
MALPRPEPIGQTAIGTPTWDGRAVRLFREAHGVSRSEVAKLIGASTQAISMGYESTRQPVTGHRKKAMALYFRAVERAAKEAAEKKETALAEYMRRIGAASA